MIIGPHLSIAKGLPEAAATAHTLGANAFQFFTRNPRGGAARTIPAEEIAAWRKARAEYGIVVAAGHMPYTVNLAAEPGRVADFARMALREDIARCGEIGAEFVIVHPGTNPDVAGGRQHIIDALREAGTGSRDLAAGGPMLLLETMAGQGHELGSLEDLAFILDAVEQELAVGVCLDSCHLFAAGYDWRQDGEIDRFLADLERYVGLERVRAMHLNDSKAGVGSHRDRHELIGQGEIGAEGLRRLLTHPFLGNLPLLLETPVDEPGQYAGEIKAARAFAGQAGSEV